MSSTARTPPVTSGANRAEALLRVEDLRVHFGVDDHVVRAVDGVDLEIHPGETLALVGESGCGKSTLARAVVGIESPRSGSIDFEGRAVGSYPRKQLCRKLQMIFQDPDASLNPRMTLSSAIAEVFEVHQHVPKADRVARICQLMEQVGLDPSLRNRYPHELSGGQRQRACIARALAVSPRLLICDEATSGLDVSVQAQILNLLDELKADLGLAYLFITHDLGVVRQIADRVAVMYLGQLVESGPADQVLYEPAHPYTRGLLAAVPRIDRAKDPTRPRVKGDVPSPINPPAGCRFHTRCPDVMERCPKAPPALYAVKNSRVRCFLYEEEQ